MTRHSPIQRRRPIRTMSKHRKGRVKDPAYLAWVRWQPSIVPNHPIFDLDLAEQLGAERVIAKSGRDWREVEAHHHDGKDDMTALPLYWWLHRETRISVHSGGGRRAFEKRFLEPMGTTWDKLIAEHRARYEAETGRSVGVPEEEIENARRG